MRTGSTASQLAGQTAEDGDASWWQQLWNWFDANGDLVAYMFVFSLLSLVACLLLLPVIVVRLPADYFSPRREHQPPPGSIGGWVVRIVRNVVGVLFVLVGLLLLLLPGQGMLMILIGLLLIDFPGKRGLERRIVSRPSILKLLNRMRARRDRPPLVVD